jgi:serine/threonine protein kinase
VLEALRAQSGTTPVLPSEHVIGGYRLHKQLTTGTFGTLYLAEQQNTATSVVLKVLSVPQGLRLRYEVFSLGTRLLDLHHPAILPTLEVNLDGIPPYVVTALAAGGSLAQRIQQSTPHALPLPETFAIITRVGQALAYLHQQHVIHRGVQPASIVFDQAGKALLTGFDLAMLAPTSGHNLQSHQIGATHYMAPEQSKGSISEKSDQYALGCIAYELCTGRRLKEASSLASFQQQRPSPPRQFNSALPIQADRAILRAVATNPDLRYDTVEAFVVALGIL